MKKSRILEAELRGWISKEEFISLKKRLSNNGKFLGTSKRKFIMFSNTDKNIDFRIRVDNGSCYFVLKEGSDTGFARRETIVPIHGKGSAEKALAILGALGIRKGEIGKRKIAFYKYKGIDFSVGDAIGRKDKHLYYFEAEISVRGCERELKVAEKRIRACLLELGIGALGKREYAKFYSTLSERINFPYDWKKANFQ